jgi:hypothetical protein
VQFLRVLRVAAVVCLLETPFLKAQNTVPAGPNTDSTYQQLRQLTLGQEAVAVNNLTLKRDAATFHLQSGTVCFTPPVQGKVTGAIFIGDGNLVLDPPITVERNSLKLLTKEDEFSETFNHLVLRFTDSTYDEIKKAGSAATKGCDSSLLRDTQDALRHNRMLKYNLDARILQDVLSPQPGGLFVAFIQGKRYNGKEVFAMDPHGAPPMLFSVAPEEVEFFTYDENKLGIWAAFHYSEEYKNGTASSDEKNSTIQIEHQEIDTTIEKNANLIGKATTTFVSQVDGLRVVPFDLFPSLRMQSVTSGGQALAFIQEDKNQDADFAVILAKPMAKGERYTITTSYSGKEAVRNEGGGNYYPVARQDWYPNIAGGGLGQFASYDLTFRIPKGMKIAATGTLVSEKNEGNENVSVWKSAVPEAVAGFNFGRFKEQEAKLNKPDYLVQSYANENPPDWVQSILNSVNGAIPQQKSVFGGASVPTVAMGSMSTTPMLKQALSQGEAAVQLYTNFFGELPFKRLAITQQTACNYGQSWPTLVWLPICSFFDSTVRHNLGLDFADRGYWEVVTPHEVAHQWWGQDVGFNSYRDQWMSEGFADMSASLFIQIAERDPKKFVKFWNDERQSIVDRNAQGFRPIDVGPLTMGYRLNNSRSGVNITRDLIYPKGAYILHMIRMMMWDGKTGDDNFKKMMHDFVRTYGGRTATTEDFKAMVEKYMTPEMNLTGDHKMTWFFNEYVYGTSLPTYHVDYANFDTGANGDIVFSFKITQSGVDKHFGMVVPIYLELADGRVIILGRAPLIGNSSLEQKIPLKGLKQKPRRAILNYFDDVLASSS